MSHRVAAEAAEAHARAAAPAPPPRSQADDLPFERRTPPEDDLIPGFDPDPRDRIPDRGETSPLEGPPPREHGGRAAIRARGGSPDRPRDPQAPSEPAPPRYARGHAAPGGSDTERRRPGPSDRYAEPERRRPSEPPRDRDRDRDRTPPHALRRRARLCAASRAAAFRRFGLRFRHLSCRLRMARPRRGGRSSRRCPLSHGRHRRRRHRLRVRRGRARLARRCQE